MELYSVESNSGVLHLYFNQEFNQISIIKISNQATFDKYEFNFSKYKKEIHLNTEPSTNNTLILIDKLNNKPVNYIYKIGNLEKDNQKIHAVITKRK